MERITKTHENFEDDDEDEESEQAQMRRQGQSLAEMWAQIAAEHESAEEEDDDEEDEDDSKATRAAKLFRTLESNDEKVEDDEVSKGAFSGMFEQTPVEEEVPQDVVEDAPTQEPFVDRSDVETVSPVQQEIIPDAIEEEIPPISEVGGEVIDDIEFPDDEVEAEPENEDGSVEENPDDDEDDEADDFASSVVTPVAAAPITPGVTPPTPSTPPAPPTPVTPPPAPGSPGGPAGPASGDTLVTNNFIDARRRSGILPAIVSGVVVNRMSKNRDELLQEQIDKGDEHRKELEDSRVRAQEEADNQKKRIQRGERQTVAETERQKVMNRDRLSKEVADRATQRRIEEERVNLLKNQQRAESETATSQPNSVKNILEKKPQDQKDIEQTKVPQWRARQLDQTRERQKSLEHTKEIPALEERLSGLSSEKARDLKLEQRDVSEHKRIDSFDEHTNQADLLISNVENNTTEVSQRQMNNIESSDEIPTSVNEKELYKKSIAAGAVTALVVVGAIIAIAMLVR